MGSRNTARRGCAAPLSPPRQGERKSRGAAAARCAALLAVARGSRRARSPSSGSAWSRCRLPAPRRSPSPCSTATTGCCAPTPRPMAAGGCRSRSRMSTRAISPCCSRSRTSASGAITASTRCAIGRAGWLLVRHRRIVSGGSTLTMQVARLLQGEHERSRRRQDPPGPAGAAARAPLVQGRNPAPLSAAGAIRRQPRRRARRLARLLRQGAAAAVAGAKRPCWSPCRSRPSSAGPDRFPKSRQARPQPRAGAHAGCRRDPARRGRRAPWRERMPTTRREFPMLAPHLGRRRGRAAQDPPGASPDHRLHARRRTSSSSCASTPTRWAGACPPR